MHPSGWFFTTQLSPLLTSNNLMYKLDLIRKKHAGGNVSCKVYRKLNKNSHTLSLPHLDSRENFNSNVSVQWPDEASSPMLLWTCRCVKVLTGFFSGLKYLLLILILTATSLEAFFFSSRKCTFCPREASGSHHLYHGQLQHECPRLRSVTSSWQVKVLSVTSLGLWFEIEIQLSATLLWNVPLAVLQLGVGGSALWLLQY